MSERIVKDVTPFEIIREIINLGWEVHSSDLILYELDKLEAENEALREAIEVAKVQDFDRGIDWEVIDALLTGESDG